MPSAVTIKHPNGAYVEVRPEDVADCLSRGFEETSNSSIPDINHGFVASRINRHRGRTAVVVGNGPSLRNLGRDKLQRIVHRHNAIVVGCNNMFDPFGDGKPLHCDYWVILDKHFWHNNESKIKGSLEHWPEDKRPVLVLHFDPQQLIIYERIVIDIANSAFHNTAYNPQIYPHGRSSGVAAVIHALHMGCLWLYLIGHDLTLDQVGNTHSFGIRDAECRGYSQGESMLPGYEVAAIWARKLGREIFNLSSISLIPSFSFLEVERLI